MKNAGHVKATLGDFCTIIMGQSPPSSEYNNKQQGLPFFQGKAEFTDLHPVAVKWCNKSNKIAEVNDVLVSVRAPVGSTNIADKKCCIGRGLAAVRYDHCNKFVFYFFRFIAQKLDEQGTGTTFRAISGHVIRNYPINLPPLPEQRAIVAKIELLFSELDNGIAYLKTAQEQLKVYRQAVLKQAFEGALTNTWREQQTGLPTAQELLEKITSERELAAKNQGKKLKPVKPLTKAEFDELPELPKGWAWVKICQIASVSTGVTPLKKRIDYYTGGIIPWITSGAVNNLFVEKPSAYVTELALKETGLKIYQKNTLLVAMYGEGKTRGKCSQLLIDATINQAIAAIVQNGTEEYIRPYLKLFFIRNYEDIRLKSSGGVQPNLNLGIIENTVIPLAPLQEQVQIVQEIETRLSVCDNIEATIRESLEKAEALRQSILKKAFEGKLLNREELEATRNDPEWEPAERLLERIRSEKMNSRKRHQ